MSTPSQRFVLLLQKPSTLGLLLLILAFLPALTLPLQPSDYSPRIGYSSEAQSVRNTSAIARLFGEFRTSLSDIMFVKTERYLHRGVAYEPHDSEDPKDTVGVKTLIRSQADDWRGFIGDLERQVKPWVDPGIHMYHGESLDLLPWFRLMTLVNPHRIRGYRIGAFILMTSGEKDALTKARAFIEEGIRNNPDSHELQFMMVRIIQQEMTQRRLQGEIPSEEERSMLESALEHARLGVELGARARPPEGWKGKGRAAEMEDSFIGCQHYEVFTLRKLGRNEEALQKALEYLNLYGDNPVLREEIRELTGGA